MKRKERIAAFGFGYPNSNRGRSSFLGRGKQAGCASKKKKKKTGGKNTQRETNQTTPPVLGCRGQAGPRLPPAFLVFV
jgi:hypothetical protein